MSSYLREENQVLREKVEKYESLLEQVMAGPLHEGVICSEYCDNNYRVEIGGHGFEPHRGHKIFIIC